VSSQILLALFPTVAAHGIMKPSSLTDEPMLKVEYRGERLLLLHQKALFWPARKTLVIADPHFGKAAAFRRLGVPIPRGTTNGTLARLSAVLAETRTERLVILGDFFHARAGRAEATLAALAAWRDAHRELEITLVRGNHDHNSGDPPCDWDIDCVAEPLIDPPFAFAHSPQQHDDFYVLAGHLHPAIWLSDAQGTIRAACFWFGADDAVLPAFGDFTGTHAISPEMADRVFAVGPDSVIEVTRRPKARRAV
jgi:DNA ligase-associated metallophosphoesterase